MERKHERSGIDMRELTASFAYRFVAASILFGAEATAITFDDGLVHAVNADNRFPFDQVLVDDGLGSIPTNVNIVAGGEIATLVPGRAPVDPERVQIGEGEALAGPLPVELDEALLALKPELLQCKPSYDDRRALSGCFGEIPELRSEASEEGFDPGLRRQLESLGNVRE